MSNNSRRPGVIFYHLKGEFSLANGDGKVVTDFKYNQNQVIAIQDYLVGGNFEGMFNVLSLEDYKLVLALHYDKIIADASSKENRDLLNKEYEKKLQELESFYEQSLQAQPEM